MVDDGARGKLRAAAVVVIASRDLLELGLPAGSGLSPPSQLQPCLGDHLFNQPRRSGALPFDVRRRAACSPRERKGLAYKCGI